MMYESKECIKLILIFILILIALPIIAFILQIACLLSLGYLLFNLPRYINIDLLEKKINK